MTTISTTNNDNSQDQTLDLPILSLRILWLSKSHYFERLNSWWPLPSRFLADTINQMLAFILVKISCQVAEPGDPIIITKKNVIPAIIKIYGNIATTAHSTKDL